MPYTSLKTLKSEHYEMMNLRLRGTSAQEIARILGKSPYNVNAVIQTPMFVKEYQRRLAEQNNQTGHEANVEAAEDKARIILERAAPRAASVQEELLESDNDSVRLKSADSILNRVLGKNDGPISSNGPSQTVIINAEKAQLLISTLQESNDAQQKSVPDRTDACSAENGQTTVHEDRSASEG